jgi:hypothetical protein
MTGLSTLAVVSGGLITGFVGMFLVTTTLRFLYGPRSTTTAEPQRFLLGRRRLAVPAVVSAFGLGGLVGYLAYSGRFAGRWGWFVGGFSLSIAYVATLVSFAMLKAKRKRSSAAGA